MNCEFIYFYILELNRKKAAYINVRIIPSTSPQLPSVITPPFTHYRITSGKFQRSFNALPFYLVAHTAIKL